VAEVFNEIEASSLESLGNRSRIVDGINQRRDVMIARIANRQRNPLLGRGGMANQQCQPECQDRAENGAHEKHSKSATRRTYHRTQSRAKEFTRVGTPPAHASERTAAFAGNLISGLTIAVIGA